MLARQASNAEFCSESILISDLVNSFVINWIIEASFFVNASWDQYNKNLVPLKTHTSNPDIHFMHTGLCLKTRHFFETGIAFGYE